MAAEAAQNREMFCNALKQLLPTARSLSNESIEKKIGKEKLQESLDILWEFIESSCEGKLTRNERGALAFQSLRCLQNWMLAQEIPVTINTLANNFHLIPFAVDKAFPFYAQSKLLKYVIIGTKVA